MEPEENNTKVSDQESKPATPIPVMDVQPPTSHTVQPGTDIKINSDDGTISQTQDLAKSSQSIPVNVSSDQTMSTEIGQEDDQQPTIVPELAVAGVEPSNNQSTQQNPMAINQAPRSKPKRPMIIIIIAILVVVGLITAATIIFLSTNKNTENTNNSTNQNTVSSEQVPPDIDKTASELDDQIQSTNDQTDMPSEESLNDASLGL